MDLFKLFILQTCNGLLHNELDMQFCQAYWDYNIPQNIKFYRIPHNIMILFKIYRTLQNIYFGKLIDNP